MYKKCINERSDSPTDSHDRHQIKMKQVIFYTFLNTNTNKSNYESNYSLSAKFS